MAKKNTMPEGTSLETLSLAAVEVMSNPFDWAAEGEGEAWENIYAPGVMCPDCETVFPDGEATAACPRCQEEGGNGYLEERASADPMMKLRLAPARIQRRPGRSARCADGNASQHLHRASHRHRAGS